MFNSDVTNSLTHGDEYPDHQINSEVMTKARIDKGPHMNKRSKSVYLLYLNNNQLQMCSSIVQVYLVFILHIMEV